MSQLAPPPLPDLDPSTAAAAAVLCGSLWPVFVTGVGELAQERVQSSANISLMMHFVSGGAVGLLQPKLWFWLQSACL